MLKLTPINPASPDHVRYLAPSSIAMIETRLGGGSDVMMFGRPIGSSPEDAN